MRNNKEKTIMTHTNQKTYHYSIRKFTVGAASIAVGAAIFLGGGQAQAAENTATANATTTAVNDQAPKPQKAPQAVETTVPTTVTEKATDIQPQATSDTTTKKAETPEPKQAVQTAPKSINEAPAQAKQDSVREAILQPELKDPHANEERFPVDIKVVKPNTDDESFFHASNIKQTAHFIKGNNASTVELTLDIPTIWDRFDVYQNGNQLKTQVTAYDKAKETAKLQFDVLNNTQSVIVKSSTMSNIRGPQTYDDVEIKFNQPINQTGSKALTQDEYNKKKETEAFDQAITLEDKIYQLKKLMAKDKTPSQADQELLADYEAQLKEQLNEAKAEFKNAPLSDLKITNPEQHQFEVLHSTKNEPSHMDFEVVKPMQVFQHNGKHYVAMTIKSDSMWDDFLVEGKEGYEHVKTIARDTQKNERTVVFPYQVGIDHYNAIVKVSLPKLNYQGAYHVRIKDLDQNKPQSNTSHAQPTKQNVTNQTGVKPQLRTLKLGSATQSSAQAKVLTAPVSQELGFSVKKEGEDQKSVMDGYMNHPAKVIKENGKTFVQFTITNPDWWKSFELYDGSEQLKQQIVSQSADQKIINFEVKPGVSKLTSKVHIVVPGINYNHQYTTQIVFNEAVPNLKEAEAKPQPKPMPKSNVQPETHKQDLDITNEKDKAQSKAQPNGQPKASQTDNTTQSTPKKVETVSVDSSQKVEPIAIQPNTSAAQMKTTESATQVQPATIKPLGTVKADVKTSKVTASNETVKAMHTKAKELPQTGTRAETTAPFGLLTVFLGAMALFWNRHIKSKKQSL